MVINKSFENAIKNPKYINIWYGGAASSKSYTRAQQCILDILTTERNYLCIRKIQVTIRDSVFALLCNIIYKENLDKIFEINKTELTITNKTRNNQIICKGLDNPEKIKSITVKNGLLTDIWIEESTELTEIDFNQLRLRLRGESNLDKRIWLTFNPILESHWIKQKLFDNNDNDTLILKTTYLDNKFLSDNDRKSIERFKDIDKYYYNVYALGEWGVLGNVIFHNWTIEDLSEIENKFNGYYYGLDFGFSGSPTGIIKVAVKENTIYILNEFYRTEMTNADIAQILKNFMSGSYIYCDCAEPKSIKELQCLGVSALPVKKGKDSVKHGIQWLRQKKIVINSNCRNFIKEIQSYKYKEDKNGNILNEPVDLNNHLIDALRYALESLMMSFSRLNLTYKDLGI